MSFFKKPAKDKKPQADKPKAVKAEKKVSKEDDKREKDRKASKEKDRKVSREKEGVRGNVQKAAKPTEKKTATVTPSISSPSQKIKKEEASAQAAGSNREWEAVQRSLKKTPNFDAYPSRTGSKCPPASSPPQKTKKDETSAQDAVARLEWERMHRERRPYASSTTNSSANKREDLRTGPKASKGPARDAPAAPKSTSNTTRREPSEGNAPRAKTGPVVAGKSIVADTRKIFPKDKSCRKEFPNLGLYLFESEQLKEKRIIAIRPEKDRFDDKEFEQGKVVLYRARPGDVLYLVEKKNLKQKWPVETNKESWSVSAVFNKDEYGLVLIQHDSIKSILLNPNDIKEKDFERL